MFPNQFGTLVLPETRDKPDKLYGAILFYFSVFSPLKKKRLNILKQVSHSRSSEHILSSFSPPVSAGFCLE